MNKKNIIRFLFLSIFLFFLGLYFYQASNYYEYLNYKKTKINYEKINEFEKDLESGKDVTKTDYIDKDKTYSNTIYKIGLGPSSSHTFGTMVASNMIRDYLADNKLISKVLRLLVIIS